METTTPTELLSIIAASIELRELTEAYGFRDLAKEEWSYFEDWGPGGVCCFAKRVRGHLECWRQVEDSCFDLDEDGAAPAPCCHCGDLFQDVDDHSCYGTRAADGDAKHRYDYELRGWE